MSKFKIGDKVVVVDAESVYDNYFNGDVGIVTSFDLYGSESCFVERLGDGLSMNVYFTEIEHFKEKEEMNAEQIRDEILRIDTRIEEAKKDIENAEKERDSLVEKLREKGFELTNRTTNNLPCQELTVGDTVRILSYNEVYHDGNCVDQTAEVLSVDNSGRPYYVRTESDDYFWCTPEEVEKI